VQGLILERIDFTRAVAERIWPQEIHHFSKSSGRVTSRLLQQQIESRYFCGEACSALNAGECSALRCRQIAGWNLIFPAILFERSQELAIAQCRAAEGPAGSQRPAQHPLDQYRSARRAAFQDSLRPKKPP
jgi:hypothetical protein